MASSLALPAYLLPSAHPRLIPKLPDVLMEPKSTNLQSPGSKDFGMEAVKSDFEQLFAPNYLKSGLNLVECFLQLAE